MVAAQLLELPCSQTDTRPFYTSLERRFQLLELNPGDLEQLLKAILLELQLDEKEEKEHLDGRLEESRRHPCRCFQSLETSPLPPLHDGFHC